MLNPRKRRLCFILLVLVSTSLALGLSLYALRQKVNLYQTPQQVLANPPKTDTVFRLGGMVVKGSVKHGDKLQVNFILTDFHAQVRVQYQGILPSLFREGQGIVAQGRLNDQGIFIADEVLAKHDANYMPPAISEVIPEVTHVS
jgi:cytochrome c-type biogenesis protein CcmE